MKRFAFILFSFLNLLQPVFSQEGLNTDSLETVLKTVTGVHRINLLTDISWEYKYNNPDKAIMYANEAIAASKKENYTLGLALAYKSKAAVNIIKADYAEGKVYILEAAKYINKTNEKYHKGKIYNLLGIVYREEMNYVKSLEYQNQAIAIFKEIKDTNEICGNMHNLAILHGRMNNGYEALKIYTEIINIEIARNNDYGIARTANNIAGAFVNSKKPDLALKYFKIAVNSSKKCKNPNFESSAYHGMATIYESKRNTSEALNYYNKAIAINTKFGFHEFLANNYFNVAILYYNMNSIDKSIEFFDKARALNKQTNNFENYISVTTQESYAYQRKGNYDKSFELANEALKLSTEINSLIGLYNSHFLLYTLYKSKNQYKPAMEHIEKYNYFMDSLRILEKENLQLELQTKFEIKDIENANTSLIAKNKLQQKDILIQTRQKYFITIISLLILIIAIILFFILSKLKNKNNELSIKNEKIEAQSLELKEINATKDKFFSIIAHDLKNPFQSLIGISEIIIDDYEEISPKEQLNLMRQLNSSSKSTYNLLENLLEWSMNQTGRIIPQIVDVTINEIIKSEIEKLISQATAKNISMINNVDKTFTVKADQNMLSLVIRNFITNAIKFTPSGGKIEINSIKEKDSIKVEIKDNGVGIPSSQLENIFKFDVDKSQQGTANEKGSGLGLILCKEFIEKLNGKVNVESEINKGSCFSFTLAV